MIFLLVLHVIFVHLSDCVLITVRRERNYDTVVWDGDCSRLNANYAGFANERTCVCRKKLKVNEIESEITGLLYQATGAFPTCLYDYREIGANMFASSCSRQIYTIDDIYKTRIETETRTIELQSNVRSSFEKNQIISIKDILLYNYSIDEPFIKIPRNTFLVTNYSYGYSSINYFYLQVNRSAMRKFKGNLMQIIFELDNRPYGTKGIFGFMVLKFVGERKYDLDLQPESSIKTLQNGKVKPHMPKDASSKIVNIVLAAISGILAVIIVILIVKQRQTKTRYREVNKESNKSEGNNVATERNVEPYMIHNPSRSTETSANNNKNQPKPNDTQHNNLRHCETGGERYKWNHNQKMKPMDMVPNAYIHSKNVQSDLQEKRANYQNINYVYDEILQ